MRETPTGQEDKKMKDKRVALGLEEAELVNGGLNFLGTVSKAVKIINKLNNEKTNNDNQNKQKHV